MGFLLFKVDLESVSRVKKGFAHENFPSEQIISKEKGTFRTIINVYSIQFNSIQFHSIQSNRMKLYAFADYAQSHTAPSTHSHPIVLSVRAMYLIYFRQHLCAIACRFSKIPSHCTQHIQLGENNIHPGNLHVIKAPNRNVIGNKMKLYVYWPVCYKSFCFAIHHLANTFTLPVCAGASQRASVEIILV